MVGRVCRDLPEAEPARLITRNRLIGTVRSAAIHASCSILAPPPSVLIGGQVENCPVLLVDGTTARI